MRLGSGFTDYVREVLGPRFPRNTLNWSQYSSLPGQLGICQPLAYDLRHGQIEAVGVGNVLLFGCAMVIAEHLLVKVAVKVERFDSDISSVDAAFQKTPEVLDAISVNLPTHVLDGVIDDFVLKAGANVSAMFVTDKGGAWGKVLVYQRV
jgi:hypothetical protein